MSIHAPNEEYPPYLCWILIIGPVLVWSTSIVALVVQLEWVTSSMPLNSFPLSGILAIGKSCVWHSGKCDIEGRHKIRPFQTLGSYLQPLFLVSITTRVNFRKHTYAQSVAIVHVQEHFVRVCWLLFLHKFELLKWQRGSTNNLNSSQWKHILRYKNWRIVFKYSLLLTAVVDFSPNFFLCILCNLDP